MDFAALDFSWVSRFSPLLLSGLWTTLWLSAVAFVLALPIGMSLAMGRVRGNRLLRFPITAFVDVMRFTPILVQVVWIHFALPAMTGYSMSANMSGLIALTLHVSAYVSEILRAGIGAIPRGQWEASKALGLTPRQTVHLIIMPQVWPLVLPPLANVSVTTFKLTAILGIIAVVDLTKAASRINNFVFRPIEVYTFMALVYLAIGLALAGLVHLIERRYRAAPSGRGPAHAANGPSVPVSAVKG